MATEASNHDGSADPPECLELHNNTERTTQNFAPILYKRRWFVLGGYCLLSISNLSVWFAFSSISNITRKYYSINMLQVSWLASIFSIVPVLLMLPASYFLNRRGIFTTILLAGALNALGSCVRYVGLFTPTYGYPVLLFGNVLCSVASCGFLFLPARIAAMWFGEKERATAVAVAISATSFGLALGYLIPTAMVKNGPTKQEIGKDLRTYLLTSAIQAVLTLIYVAVAIRDAPKTAPSHSEAQKRKRTENWQGEERCSSGQSSGSVDAVELPGCRQMNTEVKEHVLAFRNLLKSLDFHKVLHLRGLIFGLETAYLIALNEMLIPQFPGHEFEIGLMGALGLLLSVPSTYIIGVLIDKTRAYKRITIGTTCLLTLLTSLLTVFFFMRFSFYSLFSTYIIIVMVFATYYTTAFDHIAELTYPVSEANSGAVLLWFGLLYSLVFGRLASYVLLHLGAKVLMVCILSINLVVFFASFMVRDKGPRSAYSG